MWKLNTFITDFDKALRVVSCVASASRPSPAALVGAPDTALDSEQRRHSAGLMRVNHVGEICAQALYDAQARFAHSEQLRRQFGQAGREEEDHLAWTADRLRELGSRPSLLNPFWYAGAYLLGAAAARLGDARSLSFVVETEKQVEMHLAGHLESLPAQDRRSRAIVAQMKEDEIEHGEMAKAMGAAEMPPAVQAVMRAAAKVMTSTAYYI